jgi:hypothetical protein
MKHITMACSERGSVPCLWPPAQRTRRPVPFRHHRNQADDKESLHSWWLQDREHLIAGDSNVIAALRGDDGTDSPPVVAIVAGTLGALAVILLACLAMFCFKMQKHRHWHRSIRKPGPKEGSPQLQSYTLPLTTDAFKDARAVQKDTSLLDNMDDTSGHVSC